MLEFKINTKKKGRVASKYYTLGGKDSYGCLQYMDEPQSSRLNA
jgi:hypothetical protein